MLNWYKVPDFEKFIIKRFFSFSTVDIVYYLVWNVVSTVTNFLPMKFVQKVCKTNGNWQVTLFDPKLKLLLGKILHYQNYIFRVTAIWISDFLFGLPCTYKLIAGCLWRILYIDLQCFLHLHARNCNGHFWPRRWWYSLTQIRIFI